MVPEFSARVARLPSYPAAAVYAPDAETVALASNEAPWGPLPEVMEAATRAVGRANRYPDPTSSELRRALADRYGVVPERIAVGNGSADLLMALGEALLEPGAELVHAWPSFSVYPHLPAASGARAIVVPVREDDQRHDLDAMAREVTAATRLVLVCNPNNPTSTAWPVADLAAFVARLPAHVVVAIDEAYCEFNLLDDPDASVDLLDRHANLVLLRTFSKVYGLAALRVGFALCGDPALVQALFAVRQPFFLNGAASAAATEALRHQDAVAQRVERTVAERLAMAEGLGRLGITPYESQANFLFFDLPEPESERAVLDGLLERRVVVRSGAALGREGALRVTIGTPPENARFLAALDELVAA